MRVAALSISALSRLLRSFIFSPPKTSRHYVPSHTGRSCLARPQYQRDELAPFYIAQAPPRMQRRAYSCWRMDLVCCAGTRPLSYFFTLVTDETRALASAISRSMRPLTLVRIFGWSAAEARRRLWPVDGVTARALPRGLRAVPKWLRRIRKLREADRARMRRAMMCDHFGSFPAIGFCERWCQ